MGASSQISVAPKTVVLQSPRSHSPAPALVGGFAAAPLRFILSGIAALAAAILLMVLRPEMLSTYHYNQYVIGTTHLFVVGWICSIVIGAMYQLVPVALETKLYSERLARWHFWLHIIGFTGIVWTFWTWNMRQLGHFGSVFAVGVGLFVYNLARTLVRVPRWNVVATAVSCVLFWLISAVLAGLTVATGKALTELESVHTTSALVQALVSPLTSVARFVGRFDAIGAMHAHAHLGSVGVFVLLIIGVSFKLVPMFTLSEVQSRLRAGGAVLLVNVGLVGSFVAIATRSGLKPVFGGMLVAGVAVYLVEIWCILRARKRRTLDWALKYFLTGLSLLIPLCVTGLVLSWPGLSLNATTGQMENAYGLLALAGVVSMAIIGMLYKIVPFLVWQTSYSKQIGLRKVPSLADLYSHRLQAWSYWAYTLGLAVTISGILVSSAPLARSGAVALLVSVLCLAMNVAKILIHLIRPVTAALPARAGVMNSTQLAAL